MFEPGVESDELAIEIYDIKEENFAFLSRQTGYSVNEFIYLNEHTVVFAAADLGVVNLMVIEEDNPFEFKHFFEKDMLSFSNLQKLDDQHIILTASSYITPNDIYILNVETKELTNLTVLNVGNPAIDSL